MSACISVIKARVIAAVAALALAAAGSALAGPSGGHGGGGGGFHGGGGGFHGGGGGYRGGGYGGYRGGYGGGYGYHGGGWGPRGYYGGGWRGYGYGGWHGYYGGWGWRGGWGWGWGWGCCGIGLGWWLPVLPLGYATYYWSGIPYYYVDNTYYVWDTNAGQYQAVEPPSGLTTTPPSSSSSSSAATYPGVGASGSWTDLFAYPKAGQSLEQQTSDRDECHKWAINQSGFDPAQPSGDPKDLAAKREAYLRAEGACLEARNYSVK